MAEAMNDAPPPVGVGHMILIVADLHASHQAPEPWPPLAR
jgi:hypothetical protein